MSIRQHLVRMGVPPHRHRLLQQTTRRTVSEYAPPPPSPNDLKAPLPEKFSLGKNNKLQAVLFEYDILARSGRRTVADTSPKSKINSKSSRSAIPARKQPTIIAKHQENLVKEVSDLLSKARDGTAGEDSIGGLRNMGRTMIASLKDKMGGEAGRGTSATAPTPAQPPRTLQPADLGQVEDPKAKYMAKIREKMARGSAPSSATSAVNSQPGGDADLLIAARERVGGRQSGWLLREGVGDLLVYLASRSVRLGVIASPGTTLQEFDHFMEQLRAQATNVKTEISPEFFSEEKNDEEGDEAVRGVRAGLVKAVSDFGVQRTSSVLVVGFSEKILRAATAAAFNTARYHPPNSVPEGVIQNFTVQDVDEVRTVVEQLNGVSFR